MGKIIATLASLVYIWLPASQTESLKPETLITFAWQADEMCDRQVGELSVTTRCSFQISEKPEELNIQQIDASVGDDRSGHSTASFLGGVKQIEPLDVLSLSAILKYSNKEQPGWNLTAGDVTTELLSNENIVGTIIVPHSNAPVWNVIHAYLSSNNQTYQVRINYDCRTPQECEVYENEANTLLRSLKPF